MSVGINVAKGIRALKSLDLDKLSKLLRELPVPTKFASSADIPDNYHLCSEQALLDALFEILERFPFEEDFRLWSTVGHAIELFEESRVRDGLVKSIKRQPMWKTAELATQYCSEIQIEVLIQYCQEMDDKAEEESHPDHAYLIKILEKKLAS